MFNKLALALLPFSLLAQGNVQISGVVHITGIVQIPSGVPFIDCTFTPSFSCPQAPNLIATDPYSTVGGFTGYADSSERADPNTSTIWGTYSKPAVQPNAANCQAGSLSVGNNLSHWDGSAWQFNTQIFPSGQAITNGATGQINCISEEVPGLYLQNVSGTTYSYEAGLSYATSPGGAGFNDQPSTNEFYVRGCMGAPTCLSSATNQMLGWNAADGVHFPYSQNLSTLAVGSGCNKFNEPSLWVSGTTLYMTAGCGGPFQNVLYEFSTPNPQSHLGAWVWSYVGKMTVTPTQANGACQNTFGAKCGPNNLISSYEMALSQGGQPITVAEMSTGGVILGAIVFSMSSLTPPAFNLTSGGLPVVLGYATCSQCNSPTGAEVGSGYERTYPGGVMFTTQQVGCPAAAGCGTNNGTFNQLVDTHLKP